MKKFICASLLLALGGIGRAQAPKPPAPAPAPGAPAAPAKSVIDAASPDLQTATTKAYEEGFALMQDGKFKEALEKVAFIASKMNKPPAPVRFMEGACYFNLGDFAKASTAFEAYLADYPSDKDVNAVKMGLGRSYLKTGKEAEGVKLLTEVAGVPELKGEAGLLLAEYHKKAGNNEEALKILNSIVTDGVRSPEQIQAALMAADLYVAAGDTEKAAQLLESVKGGGGTSGENVIQLNNIGLKLGDKMLEEKRFREALGAYQSVRRKSEVVRLQKERIARIQDAINKAKGSKEDLEAKLAADKGMLDELDKRTDYDASLFYRLGRCYFEMQRPWEAILAFEAIVTEFKDFPQRDKAMYGLIMANASLKRIAVAQAQCEKFIRDFPDSSELGTISELFGMLSYQVGDLEGAEKNFQKAKSFPKADKEKMGYLRGNVLFEMQRFQDAITEFEILRKDFPKSAYIDDADYRIALGYFYQNDFKNTLKALQNYIKTQS
ncbi:MAG: Tetratricopeptide repeat-containing protein, partial [Verrucomicrobiaceae bacterium]|nr:Tetratricopeptide repeat-containing protein [Verrucomicrobiaceae bacterium]